MSISGSLEDVSVADVMQFIHLGRRTGTLLLHRGSERAMIGFHEGRLISAQAPGTPRLGEILLGSGAVEAGALERAVEAQKASAERRSLGQILVSEGLLAEDQLREMVSQQIERTVSELVNWEKGSFEFAVDDLTPIDEIALFPGDVVPGTDINTQMVLLEAARIFDERSRTDDEAEPAQPASGDLDDTHPVLGAEDLDLEDAEEDGQPAAAKSPLAPLALGGVAEAAEGAFEIDAARYLERLGGTPQAGEQVVLHLVSTDSALIHKLSQALPPEVQSIEARGLEDAGHSGEGGPTAIVLVDLRDGRATLGDVARIHQQRSGVPLLALVDRVVPVSQVYAAGALAALPAEPDAVSSCVQNILQSRRQLARISASAKPLGRTGSGVARLRRVFGDLRSGLLSATVALNLMHIISESVERAVLFLVRQDCLHALGAFGTGADGRPLAELTRGMRLNLDEPSALADSLSSGETLTMKFRDAILPQRLKELLGRPQSGQVVIFPVLGARRVISVIYTDNGKVDRPIEDIEILELATAQVGMAFENELLRRQISKQDA